MFKGLADVEQDDAHDENADENVEQNPQLDNHRRFPNQCQTKQIDPVLNGGSTSGAAG